MPSIRYKLKRASSPSVTVLPSSSAKSPRNSGSNRRCTLSALPAIGKVQTPHRGNKIQKRPVARKLRKLEGPDLVHKFDGELQLGAEPHILTRGTEALTANRDELVRWVETALASSERDLSIQLEQISTEFQNSLQVAEKLEAVMCTPLAHEEFLTQDQSPDGRDKTPSDTVLFGDRMEEVERLILQEEGNVGRLWNDWENVQHDILHLALEVLGKDAIGFDLKKAPEQVRQRFEEAVEAHLEVDRQYQSTFDHIHDMEAAMKDITLQTVKTAEEQQKQWKLNQQQRVKALKDALRALEEVA